jgi:hypothetical protein
VTAHAASLPKTLDEFLSFPLDYQRAIFNASSPELKSRFFQEHLLRELRTGAFSEDQKQALGDAVEQLTPEAYRQHAVLGGDAAVDAVLQHFPDKDQRQRLFYRLGAELPTRQTMAGLRLQLIEQIRGHFSLLANRLQCNCLSEDDCYGILQGSCLPAANGCELTWGCGYGGMNNCIDLCQQYARPQ